MTASASVPAPLEVLGAGGRLESEQALRYPAVSDPPFRLILEFDDTFGDRYRVTGRLFQDDVNYRELEFKLVPKAEPSVVEEADGEPTE